jgi:hypothetical protein
MKKSQLRQIIKEEITSTLNETSPVLDMFGKSVIEIHETQLSRAIDEVEKVYNIIVAGYDLDYKGRASIKVEILDMIHNQL